MGDRADVARARLPRSRVHPRLLGRRIASPDDRDAGRERDRPKREQAERFRRGERDVPGEHDGRDEAVQDRPGQCRSGEQPSGRPPSSSPPAPDERDDQEQQREPHDDAEADEQEGPEHDAAGERHDRRPDLAETTSRAQVERADDDRDEERHGRDEDGERDGDLDRGPESIDVHGLRRYASPSLAGPPTMRP